MAGDSAATLLRLLSDFSSKKRRDFRDFSSDFRCDSLATLGTEAAGFRCRICLEKPGKAARKAQERPRQSPRPFGPAGPVKAGKGGKARGPAVKAVTA